MAQANRTDEGGIKKVRKPGKHSEFDQVREYVTRGQLQTNELEGNG